MKSQTVFNVLPPPFETLPPQALTAFDLTVGETLFLQGDTATAIYFLQEGEMRLVRHSEAGTVVPVFEAVAGDTFAEAALFSPTYHCDAVAVKRSALVALNKHVILSKMVDDPEFGRTLAKRFASQVQTYRRKLEILAISSAEERVFAALSDGYLTGKVVDFADEINLSQEATFRTLSQLVRKGRIEKPKRGTYRVKKT
ncbi:Crp/Fnr family transcriptional regulator [Parasedimentitalea maritima]|uniref:Cyclic nucleotide-binding domain-containing protein n=1 Tax=Parasedimentitalea maritima TaxID=2578117 RepID=A0A6A4RE29_9RHOB|nr:Crp/Fnr family transcriptional regulator [Zongyanglinia marina]KAE9625887.1 cyclic nucleotide-binding domain-containing protein [Zongyanglinia marina]